MYTRPLPKIDNFHRLVRFVGSFPASTRRIMRAATENGFSENTLDFLRQFPSDLKFEDEEDFLNRCEELEFLIHEERRMPEENLRSPQD